MAIKFLNNYPNNRLEEIIKKKDGSPLYGEVWLYKQFLMFQDRGLVENETWYFMHDYNLSTHPASEKKVEGQVDFLLLNKNGLLVIEVKGGRINLDSDGNYFSVYKNEKHAIQDPFKQVKEYVHTFKELIPSKLFAYKAVVFPHEAGFELIGPQLLGYSYLFFSKKYFLSDQSEAAVNNKFFDFITELHKNSRKKIVQDLYPGWSKEKVNNRIFTTYPQLTSKELKRIKQELNPEYSSHGYDPDIIKKEIILDENYEILKGLRKNKNIMVQGGPGTGKTVLAKKYLTDNLLRQQKGLFYCANLLVKSSLEHIILNDYQLDPNFISFEIYSRATSKRGIPESVDFFVFDEAQEYFDKGLFDHISRLNTRLDNPRIMILYDPNQSISFEYKELNFYVDYFIENGYSHYYFDENFRCIQNKAIADIANHIFNVQHGRSRLLKEHYSEINSEIDFLKVIKQVIQDSAEKRSNTVILIHSCLFSRFKDLSYSYFRDDIEEVNEQNINIPSSKIRFTTPFKFRGLEKPRVFLLTPGFTQDFRIENYVGITRAIEKIKLLKWTI